MLIANNIVKSYGPNIVLNNVSFVLNRGQRAGLVGANGAGKTTLLNILTRDAVADSGTVSYLPDITTGFLPQTQPVLPGQAIKELLQESAGQLKQLEADMRRLEKAMKTTSGEELEHIMREYGEISARFEGQGGYDVDFRIDMVLEGLGIGYLEKTRTIDTLSGGERTRVGLAILLLKSPDLLVLDEPTNNLDWQSLDWLEKYLIGYPGAIIAASHDRQFLNNIATDIYEIDEFTHGLNKYTGNYDSYKLAKEAERHKQEEEYRQQQEEIRELRRLMKTTTRSSSRQKKPKDGDKFAPHFKGERTQRASAHVINTAEKRLERIEKNPLSKPPRPIRFKAKFGEQSIRSTEVIRATRLSKSYGEKKLFGGVSFSLGHDTRIVIIGPNGAGKTTLLRILTGIEKADSGEVSYAPGARIGFLPQEPGITGTDNTVLEYYGQGRPGTRNAFMSELLLAGIFRVEDLDKKIGELSLGQVRRLELARMIADKPNTLILDEPTNYISLDAMEALETAINEFQGPVLAVTHDRRFIERTGGDIWEIEWGKLVWRGKQW